MFYNDIIEVEPERNGKLKLTKSPHQKAHELEVLLVPVVHFRSIHEGSRDLHISRLPCDVETARKWVETMRTALGERFLKVETKEVE